MADETTILNDIHELRASGHSKKDAIRLALMRGMAKHKKKKKIRSIMKRYH